MPRIPGKSTARHIAQVAGKLFFEEGVENVHVERVAMLADVTKRTLYRHFRSRDLLVAAAVRVPSPLSPDETDGDPIARILHAFERLTEYVSESGNRGCPLANAAVRFQESDHPARLAIRDVKEARSRWFCERAIDAGFAEPARIAEELALIFDGALTASSVRMSRAPAVAAQRLVERILAEAQADAEARLTKTADRSRARVALRAS